MVRGEYDFAGKRFEFDDNGVVTLSTQLDHIRLNLSARREDTTLTAVVQIQGTAAKPEITLTSTPELPSDEVLSQVLFGASAAQLSPIEAAQLASALAALAGGGGFDVIGNLRRAARKVACGPFWFTAPRPTITLPNPGLSTMRASSGGEDHSAGSYCLTSYMK